ncbi:MAG: agmatine deiminase family protein [Bacteroidales bacterium]|nr:agmatine deiminase family protein [Bacteroidales bacterium]
MTVESIIGIVSGLIAIGGVTVVPLYKRLKKQPLTKLMDMLVDKKLTSKEHRKVLKKMNVLMGNRIRKEYIQNFVLPNKGREDVFLDICVSNEIEPNEEVCKKFLGYDSRTKRAEYIKIKSKSKHSEKENSSSAKPHAYPLSPDNSEQTVYMSELLMSRHPITCQNLIEILERHHVKYSFIKGTKDIWCRDYMPVQTKSGRFIQFKYDPSYLKGKKEWEELRSDITEIRKKNDWLSDFEITTSDINLDGGNVLICDGRAIVSDRVFSENGIIQKGNPNYESEKKALINNLSKLLECEDVIIIPALKSQSEDLTGHSDGMVRFVDKYTIIGNERRTNEYQYMKEGLQKAIDTYSLAYIDIPFFEDKDPNHPESAIGIYVNYLEVNDLIVLPIFNREEDKQVVDILQKTFPNKQIETINYNEIAKEGGLLNCTTWVVNS